MGIEIATERRGVLRWVLGGAVIGGVLIPLIAVLVDPFIPERGWMFPRVLQASFLPGAILAKWLLLMVDMLFPSAGFVKGMQGLPALGAEKFLWVFASAFFNSTIYGCFGFVLWWSTHGKKWLLLYIGLLVVLPWLAFNIAGLMLMT